MKITLRLNNHVIQISEARSLANECVPGNSYVTITIDNESVIYFGSKLYQNTNKNMPDFYHHNGIDENINLIKIQHGTIVDTPYATLPLFHMQCDRIHHCLKQRKTPLVNCNNGCSRSGTVIALYLMKHLNFTAVDALKVVDEALKCRGFKSCSLENGKGFHGSYGAWLKKYGTWNPAHSEPTLFSSPRKTRSDKFRDKNAILHTPIKPAAKRSLFK